MKRIITISETPFTFYEIDSSTMKIFQKYFCEHLVSYNLSGFVTKSIPDQTENLKSTLFNLITTQIKKRYSQEIRDVDFINIDIQKELNNLLVDCPNLKQEDVLFILYDYQSDFRYPGKNVDVYITDFNLRYITLDQLKKLLFELESELKQDIEKVSTLDSCL